MVRDGSLVIECATSRRSYTDPHREQRTGSFEQATWTSPQVSPLFPVTELVASWNARTPPGTWLEVEVAAVTDEGVATPWYVLGRWAENDTDISPTSVSGQSDELATVAHDTLTAHRDRTFATYRLRLHLLRSPGSDVSPTVTLIGAMASNVAPDHPRAEGQPTTDDQPTDAATRRHVLDVPAYSQMLHRGEYPQWANGGESWCSPTSTAMVLRHWRRGPTPEEYSWVDAQFQDRFVDHAARNTFDHHFQGPGNWAFNTAYAGCYDVVAYVTRLRSLAEAETFIRAGIPLVAAVSFHQDQLDGAGYDTEGHLLALVGFDETGDVIVNDPASHGVASNAAVRTTYKRRQFEAAWLGSSAGLVYVITPPDVRLPAPPDEPNWR